MPSPPLLPSPAPAAVSTALVTSFSRYPNIASLGSPAGVAALAAVLANVTSQVSAPPHSSLVVAGGLCRIPDDGGIEIEAGRLSPLVLPQLPDIPGFPFGIDFEKGQAGASAFAQGLLNETSVNPILLQVRGPP